MLFEDCVQLKNKTVLTVVAGPLYLSSHVQLYENAVIEPAAR